MQNDLPPTLDGSLVDVAGTAEAEAVDDTTLGGYFRVHDRPPAFDGPDGHPYTVSVEVEKVPDLRAPYEGYLVFLRWAANGLGVIGHVETETLWTGASTHEVKWSAGETPLLEVQSLLHDALRRRAELLQE